MSLSGSGAHVAASKMEANDARVIVKESGCDGFSIGETVARLFRKDDPRRVYDARHPEKMHSDAGNLGKPTGRIKSALNYGTRQHAAHQVSTGHTLAKVV